ncbi:MAG: hypothetical protein ACPG4I_04220 [Candidatus Puniceispirillaceae bacterium]
MKKTATISGEVKAFAVAQAPAFKISLAFIPIAKTPEMPKEGASRLCQLFSKGLDRRTEGDVAKAMVYGIIGIIRTDGQRSLVQEGVC